jgi:hypothetical protein
MAASSADLRRGTEIAASRSAIPAALGPVSNGSQNQWLCSDSSGVDETDGVRSRTVKGTAASVMSTTSGRARFTVSLGVLMLLNVTLSRHLSRVARERFSIPAAYTTIAVMIPTISQVFSPATCPKTASPAVPAAVMTTTSRTRTKGWT